MKNSDLTPFTHIEYSINGVYHSGYILSRKKKDAVNFVFLTDKGHEIYRQNIKSFNHNTLSKHKTNQELLIELAKKLKSVGVAKTHIEHYRKGLPLYCTCKKQKAEALNNVKPYLQGRLGLLTLEWETPLF